MTTEYAEKPLTIGSLKVRNVLGVSTVDLVFDPKRALYVVGGDNGAGKTSTIDALWYALGGGRVIADKPIKDGEKTARVELKVNNRVTGKLELEIIRTWWYGKRKELRTKLEVLDARGVEVEGGAQGTLDTLYSHLIDPIEFMGFDRKHQVEAVRECVNLDFTKLDAEYNDRFKQRGVESGRADVLKAQLAGCEHFPDAVGKVAEDTADLVAKQKEHDDAVAQKAEGIRVIEGREQELKNANERITGLEEQLAEVKRVKGILDTLVVDLKKLNDDIVIPEVGDIGEKIAAADKLREELRANEEHDSKAKEAKEAAELADASTERLDAIKEQKTTALAKAEFPVPGMSFDGDTVLFNDMPLDQCSTSEQIRVSTGMALANPPSLAVLIIRRGESLDRSNLDVIEEMAAKAKAYIITERVSTGEECNVVIKDGKGEDLGNEPEPLTKEEKTAQGKFDL